MEKSSWQVETSETQRSLGPSRGAGHAQALIAKESVEISKSIPKPKWFGIFTTHKGAKDREFGRLTPPKPLCQEYISPINPQLQIEAPAIRGLLQQFVVFKLTYAVARFFFDKLQKFVFCRKAFHGRFEEEVPIGLLDAFLHEGRVAAFEAT